MSTLQLCATLLYSQYIIRAVMAGTSVYAWHCKGQLISKSNCQAMNSSKKRMNEFVFTTMQHVFVHFLEEIEDTKKTFQN